MSIINSISTGGGGAWTTIANTSATSSTLTFPVTRAPSDWIVFRRTARQHTTSALGIIYVGKEAGGSTRYAWCMRYTSSSYTLRKGEPVTGAYSSSNSTFTVTAETGNSFTTTSGDYVLVYI